MRFSRSPLKIVLLVCLIAACPPTITPLIVSSGPRANDETARSPGLTKKAYRKIMVLPPSGDVKGAFELQLNLFERSFIQRNVVVISPAITGRAAVEHINPLNQQTTTGGGGTHLTDAERALILAKQTGADALLQVGTWNWLFGVGSRCFLKTANTYSESTCSSTTPFTVKLVGNKLQFLGRLIDVESGEVMASIKVEQIDINNMNAQLNALNMFVPPSSDTAQATRGIGNMQASASPSAARTQDRPTFKAAQVQRKTGGIGGPAAGARPSPYGQRVLSCPNEQAISACESARTALSSATRSRDIQIASAQVQQACGHMLDEQACKEAEQKTIEEVIQKIADVVMGTKP